MKRLHRHHIFLASILAVIIGMSACGEDVWDELPAPISSFIAQYFPGVGISSYSEHDDCYYVDIRNDASLTFGYDYKWTDINGNGSVLPADMMLDQLPADLYDYLESTESVGGVYAIRRTLHTYYIQLRNSSLEYDVATHTVTDPAMIQ